MTMKDYNRALSEVLDRGVRRDDRTGVGTISIFSDMMRFDLREGFPAVTTKELKWDAVTSELIWFLSGSTDERELAFIRWGDRKTPKKTIWTANAKDFKRPAFPGDLGKAYGHQFRSFNGVDQVRNLVDGILNNPSSRRHVVSLWNPDEVSSDKVALPPCHMFSQFYVDGDNLDCQYYMRSNDLFLGAPFNIASYALLTHIVAKACQLKPRMLTHVNGDAHIYSNHVEQVKQQLSREEYPLPTLDISLSREDLLKGLRSPWHIGQWRISDFTLNNYSFHPAIKAEMAV